MDSHGIFVLVGFLIFFSLVLVKLFFDRFGFYCRPGARVQYVPMVVNPDGTIFYGQGSGEGGEEGWMNMGGGGKLKRDQNGSTRQKSSCMVGLEGKSFFQKFTNI